MSEKEWLADDGYCPHLIGFYEACGDLPTRPFGRRERLFVAGCCRLVGGADGMADALAARLEAEAEGKPWPYPKVRYSADFVQIRSAADLLRLAAQAEDLVRSAEYAARAAGRPSGDDPGIIVPVRFLGRQADLFRDIYGNPFRPCYDLDGPAPTIDSRRLAAAAYDRLRPDGSLDPLVLAVLADALEESGETSERVLRHLRGFVTCPDCAGTGELDGYIGVDGLISYAVSCPSCSGGGWLSRDVLHHRGCWALDLVLRGYGE